MADLIAQSLKHMMNQDPVLRENITFSSLTDLNSQVDAGVLKAIDLMKSLSSKLIIPQNMIIPRYVSLSLFMLLAQVRFLKRGADLRHEE